MKPEKPIARRGDYTFLAEIPLGVAIPHIAERHYSKGAAKTAAALHGLLRASDGVLVGVAHWLPPTPSAQRWVLDRIAERCGRCLRMLDPTREKDRRCSTCDDRTIERSFAPDDWKRVLGLSRLAVTEGEPQNTASMLIGRSIRALRAERRWVGLLTYADTSQEHTGAIYRATNWIYCGLSRPGARWVDAQGRQVSVKTGPKTRSREEMLALGYTCEGSFAKHAFVMAL